MFDGVLNTTLLIALDHLSKKDTLTELNKLNIENTSQKADIPDVLSFFELWITHFHEKQDKTDEKNYRLASA